VGVLARGVFETLGGRGSFKSGGRELDGAFTADGASKETWYEAKSGKYWDKAMSDPKTMVSFKSSRGSVRRIAADNGADFKLISENPIPDDVTSWLAKKGYNWSVMPRS
jgi:hypothetical protein